MLGESKVFATVAVSDLSEAKNFYGDTLGLRQLGENPAGVMYTSGGGQIFVYQSTTAGTGLATCASWQVADLHKVVSALKAKGVIFEHYDSPHITWEGDIAVMGDTKAAWFKDPDGNILSIGNSEA